jgi:CDP-diacylglycerol---glycerol-3-phosphate 3-phosphatidyltransferase
LTLASWITLLRCAGGPITAYVIYDFPQSKLLAVGLFIAFAITDWLDGFVARKTNTITSLGKYLDPFADKILVLSVMIAMVATNSLPLFGVLVIVIRELAMMLLRIIGMENKKVIAASWSAKGKTVLQMGAIMFVILAWPYALELFWLATFVTVYSFVEYLWAYRKVITG